MKFRNFLIPQKVQAWRNELREKGLRNFVKSMGWKVMLLIVLLYLIRDTILYLIIPILVARGIISGC